MVDGTDRMSGREQRAGHRHHLLHYLRVYDGISSKVIGHVIDLSPGGVKMVCEEPIGVQEEYRLRLPAKEEGHRELILDAVCKWCRADDDNPDFYLAGFQIRNLGPEEAAAMRKMIRELGM